MNLGETIYRLRTETGLSQTDLAEALEVSRQSVSKWETGASIPDLDKLVKLAEIFHVTLDELVKGQPPQASASQEAPSQDEPIREASPETSPVSVPKRTAAQTAGIVLLSLTAVAAILLAALFGLAGLIFTIPTLAAGLICLFAKNHPGLKAAWTTFLFVDAYMAYATGIRAISVILTHLWTYEMNYLRLALAWVLFLTIAALVVGTAIVLRKDGWTGSKKQKGLTIAAAVVFILLNIPWKLSYNSIDPYFWVLNILFLLKDWVKLWAIAVLSTSLARWCHTRKASKT